MPDGRRLALCACVRACARVCVCCFENGLLSLDNVRMTFGKVFVVQVNNCDCKLCVFTHNVSVSFINYITYLFSGYFKGYLSTKNEMKS